MSAKFGPAGNSISFTEMGYKGSLQVPEYLEKIGLDAFEYQCGRGVNIGFDKAKKYSATALINEFGYNLDQCGFPHVEEEILSPANLIYRYQEKRASLNDAIDSVLADISNQMEEDKE